MAKRRKPDSPDRGDPLVTPEGVTAAPIRGPGYAPAFKAGIQATTMRVQEMHIAISGKTFDALQLVPGLSVPARWVQGAHDAITTGVYAAVRHGTGALLGLAGGAEQLLLDSTREPEGRELALLSALNAAAGDALARAGSPLAVHMGLHADGQAVDLSPGALAGLNERVCVFVHGLACDEHSWGLFGEAWRGSAWDRDGACYGALLADEHGISSIYLRYNTGLAIDDNGEQLSSLLSQLVARVPHLRELMFVGHSMGGLVVRRACDHASELGEPWRERVHTVVCLGSPHRGAPLEKLGHFVATALSLSNVTQSLGQMANARSQGIKDLRHGLRGKKRRVERDLALRLVAGSLADDADAMMGPVVGSVLGDGLVTTASAFDESLTGDVERVELAGLGHMALLNHPRVYALIRDWLGAAPPG